MPAGAEHGSISLPDLAERGPRHLGHRPRSDPAELPEPLPDRAEWNHAGGADPGRGSGLRGLMDRVAALGGRFSVADADGGGTRLRAEIPCA